MPVHPDTHDGTVSFLPHRLNRQPVVVLGLTANELWVCAGLSAAGGLALGVPLAILASSVAVAPASIVACVAIGVLAGGSALRRRKRGRPETWLYRQMQWWLAQRSPTLAARMGGPALVTRTGHWTCRRNTA